MITLGADSAALSGFVAAASLLGVLGLGARGGADGATDGPLLSVWLRLMPVKSSLGSVVGQLDLAVCVFTFVVTACVASV